MTSNPVPLVLLVESDPVQRDLMQMSLSRLGCDVIHTDDPRQVYSLVAKQHPSLLIIDTFIPGSSGFEIITELSQKKLIKHSLVLFVSSFGFPEVVKQAKKLGLTEFLMKPLDVDDFSKRVKKMLKI